MVTVPVGVTVIAAVGGYYWTATRQPSTLQIRQKGSDKMPVPRVREKAQSESKAADVKTVIAYLPTIRCIERIADPTIYIAESNTSAFTGKRIAIRQRNL